MDTGQKKPSATFYMPENYTEHQSLDSSSLKTGDRGKGLAQGRLVVSEGSISGARSGFYSRPTYTEPLDLFPELDRQNRQISPVESSLTDREFLFPIERERRKTSLPESLEWHSRGSSVSGSSITATGSRLNHKFRSHSVCVTDPVCRSAYDSLPKSPATSFLAQFAQPDDWERTPELTDGSVIDRYRLGKVIGRGSFSECREGTPLKPDASSPYNRVAMKIVKSDPYSTECLGDFDREIAVWRRLKHQNILPLLDCVKFDNVRIAISPVAENGSLLDYITSHGPISEAQARVLFRQIVEAVCHMHQDQEIVHRDIKLDNVLLDSQLRPYLCDFGLSECAGGKSSSRLTTSGVTDALDLPSPCDEGRSENEVFCKGSLWYLPPEELDPNFAAPKSNLGLDPSDETNDQPMDSRLKKGDVWALGVVLYGMIVGQLPFSDDYLPRLQVAVTNGSYAPLPDGCSDELKDIIRQLLTVDITQRPDIGQVRNHAWLTGGQ